jgi:uncharacterized protein YjbJ (UPF0337 family)
MADRESPDDDVEIDESPATWENIVVGEAKKLLGEATRDKDLEVEGDDQVEVAHEVRDEYAEQEHSDKHA